LKKGTSPFLLGARKGVPGEKRQEGAKKGRVNAKRSWRRTLRKGGAKKGERKQSWSGKRNDPWIAW